MVARSRRYGATGGVVDLRTRSGRPAGRPKCPSPIIGTRTALAHRPRPELHGVSVGRYIGTCRSPSREKPEDAALEPIALTARSNPAPAGYPQMGLTDTGPARRTRAPRAYGAQMSLWCGAATIPASSSTSRTTLAAVSQADGPDGERPRNYSIDIDTCNISGVRAS